MKCYICLTDSVVSRGDYCDLLEVTLISAKKNTSLQMVCLYDGRVNDKVHSLLTKYDVEVIIYQFPFKQELQEIYPQEWIQKTYGKEIEYSRIFGAFMRWEIPIVETEDQYVLYTDIDVIFNRDIKFEELPHPIFLAAAPELEKDVQKMEYFNSGVLVFNIEGMKQKYLEFEKMMKCRERNATGSFDQGYLNQLCFKDMDLLPNEYNWKPYWGINDNAKIIHLHGMKPGSNLSEAGFHTDNYFFKLIFQNNEKGYAGYVYYFTQFYDYIDKRNDTWLSNHLQYIFDLLIPIEHSRNAILQRKVKKYKLLFNTSILFAFLLIFILLYYFIK